MNLDAFHVADVIEENLYGRKVEQKVLLEAFYRRCVSSPSIIVPQTQKNIDNEIVLVTGKSGTGKTALANTLREHVVEKDGYFISGKFDQMQQKPEPYSTFVEAFTEYTHLIIDKGSEVVSSTRQAILDAIGPEISFVIDVVPALEFIVGPKHVIRATAQSNIRKGADAQACIKVVFCRFVRAICSYDCPLVLFMDDLQWSDAGTVDLLEALILDEEIQGLMLLGTCRHDEISSGHKLSTMLRKIENEQLATITNITCTNLSLRNTNDLVSNFLKKPPECVVSFSDVVHEKTGGNVFFVLQYLKELHENNALYIGQNNMKRQNYKGDIVNTKENCNDVVELLVEKMLRLRYEVQEMLMVASCIGTMVDEYLLFEILTFPDVDEVVLEAVRSGFISPTRVAQHNGVYKFTHDKVQQAAYSMIPEEERDEFHLYIGRRLIETLPDEDVDMNIFLVVNQLSHGIDHMQDQMEKNKMASLCLTAGEKAASSSDFATAASYLLLGIDQLDKDHWVNQYFLSLDLYNLAAEMEYCNANFKNVDKLVDVVLSNARILRDKFRAYMIQVNSLGTRQKLDMAIDKGLEVLKLLGQKFRTRHLPMKGDFFKTQKMLRKQKDVLRLSKIIEWDKIAALQMLNLMSTYVYWSSADKLEFVACRMVQLTLKCGLGSLSSVGFAMYGVINCDNKNYDEGHKYGQLALRILDKFENKNWLPRVYILVHAIISIWKTPLYKSLDPLRQGHKSGLQTGDIEFSMLSAHFVTAFLFHSGQPLHLAKQEVIEFRKLKILYKQKAILPMSDLFLQSMLNFMGESQDPLILTGDVFDEELALKEAKEIKNNVFVNMIYTMKLVLAYYFNDYNLAIKIASLSENTEKTNRATYMCCTRSFYHGLSCLAMAQQPGNKRYVSTAKEALEKLRKAAMHCPENFSNKVLLIEAEMNVLHNNIGAALIKYNASMAKAKAAGLRHEHALACERAGRALVRSGSRIKDGLSYLSKACKLYQEWGAHGKHEQLRHELDLII